MKIIHLDTQVPPEVPTLSLGIRMQPDLDEPSPFSLLARTLGPSRLTSATTGTSRYQPIRDTGKHRDGRIHTPRSWTESPVAV